MFGKPKVTNLVDARSSAANAAWVGMLVWVVGLATLALLV